MRQAEAVELLRDEAGEGGERRVDERRRELFAPDFEEEISSGAGRRSMGHGVAHARSPPRARKEAAIFRRVSGRTRGGFRALGLVHALALVASACDRGIGPTTRSVVVHGLPTCPGKTRYTRPIVVRLDRERALFEEPWSTQTRVDAPASDVTLTVPRARMHTTLRFGLCVATALATWDCAAATWLDSAPLTLDGRASNADVTSPKLEVECAL